MKHLIALLGLFLFIPFCPDCGLSAQRPLTEDVNPFTGSVESGNVFPGVCRPFGMVKITSDNGDLRANQGYNPHEPVQGFGHLHVNGSGGGPKYGNIMVMPWMGMVNPEQHASDAHSYESVPGYFSVFLDDVAIKAEFTATNSSAMHRYTFTRNGRGAVIFDMGKFLGEGTGSEAQKFVSSGMQVISPTEIQGYSEIRGGWNMGDPFKVYFYAMTDTKADSVVLWEDGKIQPAAKELSGQEKTGGYFTFSVKRGQQVQIKIGISYISTEKARANVTREITDWDFDRLVAESSATWDKQLQLIRVKGRSRDAMELFYSSLYRCFLTPTDKTGENPGWNSSEPYYDDFFCIWDTYRSLNPLFSIIQPTRESEIVRSLIDTYKHEGYLPDARSGNSTGRTQGGSNADVVLAEAIVKGLPGIDRRAAFEAMQKDATVEPPKDEWEKWGRSGLTYYLKYGFLPPSCILSCSKTVEYAYDDYCIASVAGVLGDKKANRKYLDLSDNWTSLWNQAIECKGAKGFIWPRYENKKWADTIREFTLEYKFTTLTDGGYNGKVGHWAGEFYESNSWVYSFYTPQNMKKLIEYCGGRNSFEARLDTFFANQYFDISNEPSFLIPCLYNYIGKQWKTAERVKLVRDSAFINTVNGLPGNDDAGTMAAWYVFQAMGFFPVAGQDVYLISSPLFEETDIQLESGKTFRILAHHVSDKNIFIQSAVLNGKELDRSWFRHSDITDGGELTLEMGSKPVHWDKGELPPSEEIPKYRYPSL